MRVSEAMQERLRQYLDASDDDGMDFSDTCDDDEDGIEGQTEPEGRSISELVNRLGINPEECKPIFFQKAPICILIFSLFSGRND